MAAQQRPDDIIQPVIVGRKCCGYINALHFIFNKNELADLRSDSYADNLDRNRYIIKLRLFIDNIKVENKIEKPKHYFFIYGAIGLLVIILIVKLWLPVKDTQPRIEKVKTFAEFDSLLLDLISTNASEKKINNLNNE